jgi:hypothetical protein
MAPMFGYGVSVTAFTHETLGRAAGLGLLGGNAVGRATMDGQAFVGWIVGRTLLTVMPSPLPATRRA